MSSSDHNLVRAAITTTWERIGVDYWHGRICSEASLEAAVYFHLRSQIEEHMTCGETGAELVVFAQPGAFRRGEDAKGWLGFRKPDIVVCSLDQDWAQVDRADLSAGRVLAVIELKFQPHWRPIFADDLEKFAQMATGAYRVFPILPAIGEDHPSGALVDASTEFYFGSISRSDASASDVNNVRRVVPVELRDKRLTLLVGPVKQGGGCSEFRCVELTGERSR